MSLLTGSHSKPSNTSIKFVRNVGAHPKNSSKNIYEFNSKFSSAPHLQSFFMILLRYEHNKQLHEQTHKFVYGQNTTVSMLVAYLKHKLKKDNVFFVSSSLHLDYFLMLPHRLVSEISLHNISLTAKDIKLGNWRYSNENSNSINYQKTATNLQVNCPKISLNTIEIIKCIGSGGFSKVFLGRLYGMLLAVKVVDKQFIISTGKQTIIENQRLILEACEGHPFITKLYAAFQTRKYVVFVMEYCSGGQLFNLLRKVKKMSQKDAKFYFLETLIAIEFLHSKGILYRDLKPENIMIDSEGHVRLADFGLSKVINDQLTYSFCGSAEYMSPEMLLKKGHSYQVDYYCLGALLYELVTGLPPYYTTDQAQLFDSILNNQLTFPSHTNITSQIRDFLTKMLQKDVSKRFKNIKEIMKHPWVAKNLKYQKLYEKKLKTPYPTEVFTYNFDDSQFAWEQSKIMEDMEKQSTQDISQPTFPGLYYQSQQIISLKNKINDNQTKRANFLKTKSTPKINILSKSREDSIRSRQHSIASQSSNNQYFPSRRQTFDSVSNLKNTKDNSQSTPFLHKFLTKVNNNSSKISLDKQRIHSRQNSINSLNNNNNSKQSQSSGGLKNIYTTKAGYFQNKYSSKLNNNSYSRFWQNKNHTSGLSNNKSNFRSAKNLGTYLYSLGNSSNDLSGLLQNQYSRSLDKSNDSKNNSSITRSMSKDMFSLGMKNRSPDRDNDRNMYNLPISGGYSNINNNNSNNQKREGLHLYSKKFIPSEQLSAKKYLDVHKLNMSKLKKSGFQNADKSGLYQNTSSSYQTAQYRK